jgi:hypothetical protein
MAIAVDPTDPLHILASLMDAGLDPKVSYDGGRTWKEVKTGVMKPGEYWDIEGVGFVGRIVFAPSMPRLVLASVNTPECWSYLRCDAGKGRGIIYSDDGGESWHPSSISVGNVMDLTFAPSNNAICYALVHGSGLYRSGNAGATWNLINANPLPPGILNNISDPDKARIVTIKTLEVDPMDPDYLYAGIIYAGVVVSADGGKQWQAISAGLPAESSVYDLAIDPNNPQVVYAATEDSGVFVSTNRGQSWRDLNTGLLNRCARQLAISEDGTVLYVATDGAGVFRLGTPPVSGSHP